MEPNIRTKLINPNVIEKRSGFVAAKDNHLALRQQDSELRQVAQGIHGWSADLPRHGRVSPA